MNIIHSRKKWNSDSDRGLGPLLDTGNIALVPKQIIWAVELSSRAAEWNLGRKHTIALFTLTSHCKWRTRGTPWSLGLA